MKCPHCGGVAWEFLHKPVVGEKMSAYNIIHVDGQGDGGIPSCDTCRKPIAVWYLNEKYLIEE